MRYKNNVLDKLVQLESAVNKVHIQVNRGGTQDSVNESIETLKEHGLCVPSRSRLHRFLGTKQLDLPLNC